MSDHDNMPEWFEEWVDILWESISTEFESINENLITIKNEIVEVNNIVDLTCESLNEIYGIIRVIRGHVRQCQARLRNVTLQVSACEDLIRDFQASFLTYKSVVDQVSQETAQIKKSLTTIQLIFPNILFSRECWCTDQDDCKMLVSGFPLQPTISDPYNEVTVLLEKMNWPLMRNAIIHICPWDPLTSENANDIVPPETLSPSRTLLLHFASPTARNQLAEDIYTPENLTANDVFGRGGATCFTFRPIWPKAFYDLYKKTETKCRELHYNRPFIRNKCIFVKATGSYLIAIESPEDLRKLS